MTSLTLGLIAAICWGIHDITIRYLSSRVPLMAALLWVLLVGAVFQFFLVLTKGELSSISTASLLLSIAAGVAFLAASLGLYFAFERGPVRVVAPVIASYPIASLGFAVLNGGLVSWGQLFAVFSIVAGVGIVAVLSDDDSGKYPQIGPTVLLSAIAAIGFATTFFLGQQAASTADELSTTLISRLTTLTLLIILMTARRAPYYAGWPALIPLTLMGLLDGIALNSVISAARLPNPEFASVASSIFGMLTILLAWIFLKERLTFFQWVGCFVAFAGIGYLAL